MDDLREHLDASIGAGPAHRDLAPLLAAGRRAVRRRRIAAGVGALAVVAVVGSSVALAAGGPDAARDPQPAGTTSSVPSPSPSQSVEPEQPWTRGEYVRYIGDQLEIRPGVKVLDRVDDYLGGNPKYPHSVALDVMFQGTEVWATAETQGGSVTSSSASEPSDGWADFRAWVADQAAANGVGESSNGGYPDLVSVHVDGTFDPVGHTQVLAQTTDHLPDGFDRAAYVELDGHRYLVLSRTIGGQPDLITVHAEPHGDTLDALLAYARDKYASGEGVR